MIRWLIGLTMACATGGFTCHAAPTTSFCQEVIGTVPAPPIWAPVLKAPPLVNINTATARELGALPGIGPDLAERIMAYREKNGPFKAIEHVRDVPGVGRKTFLRLAPLITIAPQPISDACPSLR